jgi:hypothetical protein
MTTTIKSEADPRGIGSAFYRAGMGIGQKGACFKSLPCNLIDKFYLLA